jgi:nucleoside-diphosphate-sugar epimerase
MRIFLAGATGVLGRALIPYLSEHEVVGLTRDRAKIAALEELGVDAVLADAYDRVSLVRVIVEARPEVVVNFLTDLTGASSEPNARIRRVAGPSVVAAAQAASAERIVVESVAWPLDGESAEALSVLESSALQSGLGALVIRFGRLWGPGTWHAKPPEPPHVHITDAGRRAAALIIAATTGIEVVA